MMQNLPCKNLAIVAGEPSSDWIGSLIYQGILKHLGRDCQFQAEGIAGERLVQSGVHALYASDSLAVRGYVEVLRAYPKLLKIQQSLQTRWQHQRPAMMIGVDAPDFNLGLEAPLRRAGVPTVHAVCPSIWAWRAERIAYIKKACDHVLCIFPFEPEILCRADISATYIGHPFAQIIPLDIQTQTYRAQLNLPADSRIVAVLPGSRMAEVRYLGPTFIELVQKLFIRHPQWHFVTPLVSGAVGQVFQRQIPEYLKERWHVFTGQSHAVLGASDLVVLASGTATLEAMLFKKPMVIAYKMPYLTWWLSKNKAYLPYIGLPNILSGRFVVPEYLQNEAEPLALCKTVERLMDNELEKHMLYERFSALHHTLLRDSGALAAKALAPLLNMDM